MDKIPLGTVTFVFTDIVGSTRLWERFPVEMAAAVRRHDELLRRIFEEHAGYVFKTVGDSFCVAFEVPRNAVLAAVAVQLALALEDWGGIGEITVRTAIHAGPVESRAGDYFGGTVNRVARIESAAHGRQILTSQIVGDLLVDDPLSGITFKPLGEHRLRSLERSESLLQVVADGLPVDFPPPRSLEVMPNNLPLQTTSFVGREVEMEEVTSLILNKTRLLTLVGTGGTGKTRLSLEVGARVIQNFPDGVWQVELAPITEPSQLLETVAAAVGAREEPGVPPLETLQKYLRAKKMLLILDNCEHLSAAVATLVRELLRTSAELRVLATSRHLMGITGESSFSVPPLGIFDVRREAYTGADFVQRLTQYDSVKLFIERAVSVRPDFAVNNQNAPAVAEICSRLDGIPLAIELAAARVRLLSVSQIAARLNDRFRLLKGGGNDRLPHQQTLKALIDWSYDLLSEPERQVFRRLGVFVGGRTLESIEAVCMEEDTEEFELLDLLQQLIEKSLLSVELEASGIRRYTLIESVWQYSRDKLLESGEDELLRNRHLDYFLKFAEELKPAFEGPDQVKMIDRFSEEIFNFHSAIRWSLKSNQIEKGMRIMAALERPLEVRGFLTEAQEFYSQIYAQSADKPPLLRAAFLQAAARVVWTVDLYDKARKLYAEAVPLFYEGGDELSATFCEVIVGFLDRGDRDLDEAERRFSFGLEYARKHNDERLLALAYTGLGSVAMDRGDFAEARRLKEESLVIYRRLGDLWVMGLILWGLAKVAISQRDMVRADQALCEWTGICIALGNKWSLPYILETFGESALAAGDLSRAATLLGGAQSLRNSIGIQFSPVERKEHEESMAKLRELCDEETLKKSWQHGSEMSADDLMKMARRTVCAPVTLQEKAA